MRNDRASIDRIWRHHLDPVPFASWQVRLDDLVLTEETPDRPFSGASMIKTALAALVADDVIAGHRTWRDAVWVAQVMLAPGDGLLSGMSLPRTIPLDEALTLMIAVSDNTATNALVETLGGLAAVDERMTSAGWSARLLRWVGSKRVLNGAERVSADPRLPTPCGLSRVSILDHQLALERIRTAGARVMAPFFYQQDRRSLARWVSGSARFAHKTGTIGNVRHDAGVLMSDLGELWVACFTDGGPSDEFVDHPSCLAMASAMRDTMQALGLDSYLAGIR